MAPPRPRPKMINSSRSQRVTGAKAMCRTIGKAPVEKNGVKGSIVRKHA